MYIHIYVYINIHIYIHILPIAYCLLPCFCACGSLHLAENSSLTKLVLNESRKGD